MSRDDHNALPWMHNRGDGGPEFASFIDNLRIFLDVVAGSRPPAEVWKTSSGLVEEMSASFARYEVPEDQRLVGHRHDLPSRGQVLTPAVIIDTFETNRCTARVTFGRHFLGGNGAVHGGAVPLVFDEVLGQLAHAGERSRSRTAYLHVNYRAVTPIDKELQLHAHFDREEGRKRFLIGELRDSDTVVADAEGLFVSLRPGQP